MSQRSRLLLAAVAALAVAAVGGVTATSATFSDRAVSGNTFQAATLPAPINLSATTTGGGTAVTLDWDPAPGDFADGWEIFRTTGPCAGWTPSEADLYATSSTTDYVDNGVSSGNTYCYAVRGTYNQWDSPITSPVSETVELTITRLYTHDAGGGAYQLIESEGTGYERFGCLALAEVLLVWVCLDGEYGPDTYTFSSASTYNVYSASGWRVSLDLDWIVVLGLTLFPDHLDVTAWYAAGACGAPPPGGSANLVGTAQISFSGLIFLLVAGGGVFEVPLTPNPSFVAPGTPQTICLDTRVNTSLISVLVLATLDINNGPNSWLEGAFGP